MEKAEEGTTPRVRVRIQRCASARASDRDVGTVVISKATIGARSTQRGGPTWQSDAGRCRPLQVMAEARL